MASRLAGLMALLVLVTPAAAATPPTTIASGSGQILGVAQNGQTIAWLESTSTGCRVRIRTISNGHERTAKYAPGCNTAEHDVGIAVAQVGWGGYEEVKCSDTHADVYATSGGPARLVEEIYGDCLGQGPSYQGLASDGTKILYSVLQSNQLDDSCRDGGTCRYQLASGRLMQIVGTHRVRLSGFPPAVLIAAAAGRVALVPPAQRYIWHNKGDLDWPRAATNGAVQIRNTQTHAAVTSFAPRGIVRAIALSAIRAVVLVQRGSGLAIEWYDSDSGAQLGHFAVPAKTTWHIATDGRYAAYAIGRAIHLFDLQIGTDHVLAQTSSEPVGLAIQNANVSWAVGQRILSARP